MFPARTSHRAKAQLRWRKLLVENLEERRLLAVVSQGFKTLDYQAVGTFSGNTRAQVTGGQTYHDDFAGNLNFTGSAHFSSAVSGSGTGTNTGTGSGDEDCFPGRDHYEYYFTADNEVAIEDGILYMDLYTTDFGYSNSPCTTEYVVGHTPFDDSFAGTLNISSIPYIVTMNAQESGFSGGFPYTTNTNISIQVTPLAKDFNGEDIPFDITVDGEVSNGFASIYVSSQGPTLAAPTNLSMVSSVNVYFASGPNAADVIGNPIETYPIYWNTAWGHLDIQLPETLPVGATHIVAIADPNNQLVEATEGVANVFAQAIPVRGAMSTYSFQSQILLLFPNESFPNESPGTGEGGFVFGEFQIDATGQFGQLDMDLANVPQHPTRWYSAYWGDLNEDGELDLSLTFENFILEWTEYPYVAVTLRFFGPGINEGEIPSSLSSFESELHIGSEGEYSDYGFSLLGSLEVTKTSGLQGLDSQLTLAEETSTAIDIVGLYSGVEVVPGSIQITEQPMKGNVLVNPTTGSIAYTPFANTSGTDYFSYTIQDVEGNTSYPGLITVTITEVPEPYQNPLAKSLPDGMYYVNDDDQIVSALDAVYIIIELNATGPHALTAPTGTVSIYFDVNGDNFLGPIDALLVIIRLNAGSSGEAAGEGGDTSGVGETIASAENSPAETTNLATDVTFVRSEVATEPARFAGGDSPLYSFAFAPQQRVAMTREPLPIIAKEARIFRLAGLQRTDDALAEEFDWLTLLPRI